MAAFRTNLKQLMLRKSVELGYSLTQKEVSEKTGLSLPAIARWYQGSVSKLEADSVASILNYLGCTFPELVEFVDDKSTAL